MQILYKNATAKKQFCSKYKKKWRYPEQVKKKLESAENFIHNAESLMDVASYPPFHFERLKGIEKMDGAYDWVIQDIELQCFLVITTVMKLQKVTF